MRPILTSVAFRDSELKEEDEEESVVRDVLDICAVHGLEDVVIAVCKVRCVAPPLGEHSHDGKHRSCPSTSFDSENTDVR